MPVRTLVVWIPDWPVVAFGRESGEDAAAVAVVEKNIVVACSAAARAEGVRRGQRRRDAQGACPRLQIVAMDAARDHRAFAPLVAAIERLAPHVQIIRSGLCALKARGPARYYGGEEEAANVLRAALHEAGVNDVRIGIADGPFTAEQAARAATTAEAPVRCVPPGLSGPFLAPLPATLLHDAGAEASLASLLARLGIHTLGAFAELPTDGIRDRLGEQGVRLQALAAGADSRTVTPRDVPPELDREVVFEPPVELAEQAAFGMRVAAEEFIARLDALRLVCTELRVELESERGERSERVWLHPGTFDAAAVVDRVRWQLAEQQELRSPVARVRISPEAVDDQAHHVPGLFGRGEREKVHHALSRVQAMLGHRSVLTPVIAGGRWLDERQVMVPWGDRAVAPRDASLPWPGSLPAPLPTTVFPAPRPAEVRDAEGTRILVDERGAMSGTPADIAVGGVRRGVLSWAGPWTVIEREWDAARRRVAHRFQIVDAAQVAWLLVHEDGRWSVEARYD